MAWATPPASSTKIVSFLSRRCLLQHLFAFQSFCRNSKTNAAGASASSANGFAREVGRGGPEIINRLVCDIAYPPSKALARACSGSGPGGFLGFGALDSDPFRLALCVPLHVA